MNNFKNKKFNKKIKYEVDSSKCAGCGACIGICSYEAIKIKNGRAVIDEKKCQKCGQCIKICPFGAIKEIKS